MMIVGRSTVYKEAMMSWIGEAPLLLFRGIGGPEIAIVAVVLLLIFGAGRLPQIGSSLGRSLRAFKDSVTGLDDVAGDDEPEKKKTKAASTEKDQA